MKITLSADDVQNLIDSGSLEVELDETVFQRIGLDAAVQKSIGEHTSFAGPLYQEIREQVDEYMKNHLPTKVGNYVRTVDHTAQRIIREKIAEEIDKGVRLGIELHAEKTARRLAEAIK